MVVDWWRLDHIRLTLDYQEDYDLIKKIIDSHGHYATPDDIIDLLHKKPELLTINSFRQQEWKLNQDMIKKAISTLPTNRDLLEKVKDYGFNQI